MIVLRVPPRLFRWLRRLRCDHGPTRTLSTPWYVVEWCTRCGAMLRAEERGRRIY